MEKDGVDKYQVHDLQVADRPIFAPSGKVIRTRTVQYYIGDHGPFYFEDAPEQLNAAAIRAGIEAHQAELRTLEDIGKQNGV